MSATYLSREGFEKMHEELKELKKRRLEISKQIGTAREHGDLKENAEYHAAREAQGINEARINELEYKISTAKILDDMDNLPTDEIYIGVTVELLDMDTEAKKTFILTSQDEANFAEGKISISSPIGKGLLGHKVDDIVKITVPAKTMTFKVLKIERN